MTDPEYAAGLRAAVQTAISYGIRGIEAGANPAPAPIPAELLAQARQAACNGVGIDVVLRRYFAGYALLGDLVLQEAERVSTLSHSDLQGILRDVSTLFDHVLVAINTEYHQAREDRMRSSAQRRAARVQGLLAGEARHGEELDYALAGWHLGGIACGPGAGDLARSLAGYLDRELLLIQPEPETAWFWLGGGSQVTAVAALEAAGKWTGNAGTLAIGEPGEGIFGWRLTHRQAKAAIQIARFEGGGTVCYSEVGLLASVLEDDTLLNTLRTVYLAPLAQGPDDGETLRETLRAYFATNRNSTSAAAALGVSRRTINNRLRLVEKRVGRPINSCMPELEVALRIDSVAICPQWQAASSSFPA
jgi:PucR-like helix-turn-helix protein/diguanylate cyclase with GGDEF domain